MFTVRNFVILTFSIGLAFSLTACVSGSVAPQPVAPVSGSGAKPLSSSQLLEPLKGGLIGGNLGTNLTPTEKQRGLAAEYQALETSFGLTPVLWKDETTGNSGEVVAGAPYRVGQQDCRPFTHNLTYKLIAASASGAACRQANGSWLLL